MDIKSKIILISGPTASGKSNFAIEFAKKNNGEIINADSMQVYKELKILTARPDKKEQKKIKHHLYGIVSVKSNFSTGQWLKLAIKKIREIKKLKKVPILVGGTGLYFNALEKGLVKIPKIPTAFRNKIRAMQKEYGQKKFYNKLLKIDKKVKKKIDPNDIQRSIRAYEVKSFTKKSIYDWIKKTKPYFRESSFLKFYINIDKENLINRIEKRINKMIRAGAVNEVKNYRKFNFYNQSSASKIIGIEEIGKFLDKTLKIEKTKELILVRTRQYAKRQKTWARGKMSSWIKIEPRDFHTLLKK
tara:strand:- start:561 stop:1466 length:906 start_codon:yes stop_codon:yes gene_type:complete